MWYFLRILFFIICVVYNNVFLFTSLARGYRPGGINQFVADLSVAPYDPENTLNYELGAKTNLLNNGNPVIPMTNKQCKKLAKF